MWSRSSSSVIILRLSGTSVRGTYRQRSKRNVSTGRMVRSLPPNLTRTSKRALKLSLSLVNRFRRPTPEPSHRGPILGWKMLVCSVAHLSQSAHSTSIQWANLLITAVQWTIWHLNTKAGIRNGTHHSVDHGTTTRKVSLIETLLATSTSLLMMISMV